MKRILFTVLFLLALALQGCYSGALVSDSYVGATEDNQGEIVSKRSTIIVNKSKTVEYNITKTQDGKIVVEKKEVK